jgi:thiol-disulfide isomerase/thioredoxin
MRQALWLVALAGCGSGGGASECDPQQRAFYPPGPYGVAEGDIIADHEFVAGDGSAWTFTDVRGDPEAELLLLATSAGWCTACIEEQPTLEGFHQRYSELGLVVVVALFEGAQFDPADPALARAWQGRYGLSFPVVADPDFVLGAYYDAALTPMNMVVDLCSMEILSIHTGTDTTAEAAIIEARL